MRVLLTTLFSLLCAGAPMSVAHAGATVTYLTGKAEVKSSGKAAWKTVKKGVSLREGHTVRTSKKTRVELKFRDGSIMRVGPESKMTVNAAKFEGKTRSKVSVRLWVGKVWSKVVKAARGTSSFEVRTENAVGGVRGTSFAVFAAADASAIVRVYAGSVGVRPA